MKPLLDNFSKQSAHYALYRPTYPPALYDFLLSHTSAREAAWDCGTGNGQVAVTLSNIFSHVWATDISENQLKQAPVIPNISYVHTRAEQTSFASNTFDLITIAQAIHWFDFGKFYEEVYRTAKPNALIAIWGYGLLQIDPILDPIVDSFYSEQIGKYWDSERKYIDEAYRTIPFPFQEIATPGFEIEAEWNLTQLEGYFNTWSSVQKYIARHQVNPVQEVIHQIQPYWQPTEGKKQIRFPVFMRAGRIVK